METINTVLKVIEEMWMSSGTVLWLKVALSGVAILGGVWWWFMKNKMRTDTANTERERDRTEDIGNNDHIEGQNSHDGGDIRDQLDKL